MITPRFECSQTAESVIIKIYCTSVRAGDVEIHVEDTLFTIHINPYFLRLDFSHSIFVDEESTAKYDPSSGYLTVTLTKKLKSQDFSDLDLLARLLAPRQSPLIEVICKEDADVADELVSRTNTLSLEHEELLLGLPGDRPLTTILTQTYGFLNLHSGYFKHVSHTENEVNELGPDAETCPVQERRARRWKHEDEKWDEEHYMADYADDEYIQEFILWKNPRVVANGPFQFTEQENLVLLNLPRKEYLTDARQTKNLYLTLTTILFSYAYETRTTQGDSTPESAWTICSLTPAFSALDSAPLQSPYPPFPYPFSPGSHCMHLFLLGKRTIVRCLLETKFILEHHEVYYVYSKIWLEDFCAWVQASASDDALCEIGAALKNLTVSKGSIGWDLEVLEAATRDVQERDSDSDDESDDEAEVARQL
ncbi:SHQ1 protein-domain-containing protein [Mycena maculata]|uniref:SHQ1 protein-domain-containing protein n=1 Tax=Mycena maculata TaxID=230809 RepID=A0AAD7JFB5_9AGAR|nr:SHQ1 protein-domain-containing protein [Mycena maculata]